MIHACRGLFQKRRKGSHLWEERLPRLLAGRAMPVRIVRKRAFTPGAALYMPHRATLNDEIFADGRKGESDGGGGGGREGPRKRGWGERSRIKVLLRPAFATAFASLLRSRGTMTNPRHHCDRSRRSLRKSAGKRGKRWKEFDGREEGKCRGGLRAGEKRGTLKELVYAWRSLAADYMDHCARTTPSAHVGVKGDKARKWVRYFCAALLDREGGKARRKGESPLWGIVVVRVIKTSDDASRYESH